METDQPVGNARERMLARPFLSLARSVTWPVALPNFVTSVLNWCERSIYNIPCGYPRCGAVCPGTFLSLLMIGASALI